MRKGKTRDKLYKLSTDTLADVAELLAVNFKEQLLPWDRCETYIYNRYNAILKLTGPALNNRIKNMGHPKPIIVGRKHWFRVDECDQWIADQKTK